MCSSDVNDGLSERWRTTPIPALETLAQRSRATVATNP